ncbi:dTDP-4-dehydrorhamnose 3,5-epimerase family protein [Mesorhizobium sp. VK23B]|uniref:dTDP-4-dehydrorhamnose 3,5-epimerase n=1 Tax=Mesorhizobium dulcispinae TaxID=3072316 RepID=A0ABU4XDI3_9HYPH|nr:MULTISPECIES: dTDP-4-dehydrorhamnose 3,5-epimerase family protein [unclassified Mesorhizobium]MDX8466441.1 dTDP-4-dehydrorhamnose 3,5-epimerase family protein [Mesorhizobium sp. VK23B]MDX8472251.1 dTDP-4-dehydrorhamnose 3,5-epimerase family protein [Mesorhizobium sp. VK23A]MDX8521605.1 dTDP-4-dehydrorhamnose 3,5-epimerase family protein [Mesorhizobium sp. VK23D]
MQTLSLDDFVDDKPWHDDTPLLEDISSADLIAGVRIQRLITRADKRGDLTVLISALLEPISPPPHVYLVSAEPGSIRAWVYHKRQSDRLACTNGDIRVVLYDLRKDSPTYQKLEILDVGAANKVLLTIPPYVVHGVHNRGKSTATFVNMPTNFYDPKNPDKARIRFDHPGIPYRFE